MRSLASSAQFCAYVLVVFLLCVHEALQIMGIIGRNGMGWDHRTLAVPAPGAVIWITAGGNNRFDIG